MHIPNNPQTFRLLAAVNLKSPFGFRDHRLMQLALHTGLRVSELSHLDVHHVARGLTPREVLDLPAPLAKRHKARLIPFNAVARRLVAELLAFNQARGLSVAPEAPLPLLRTALHHWTATSPPHARHAGLEKVHPQKESAV
jgi:site-specific recombinase XerD